MAYLLLIKQLNGKIYCKNEYTNKKKTYKQTKTFVFFIIYVF